MNKELLTVAAEFIARHEGFRERAYRCPAGVWTVGYGHTEGVKPGDVITRSEALRLLKDEIGETMRRVEELCPALTDNQSVAVTSFIYNVGMERFRKSTLLRLILEGKSAEEVSRQFGRWIYAGGRISPGLVKRRAEEAAMFCAG